MQPPPKPAITQGQPRVVLRWWRSFALTMLALAAPGLLPFINLPQGGYNTVLLAIAVVIQISAWLYFFQLYYRWTIITRAIKQRPPACLNGLYLLVPNQPICPECGYLQNRLDLSPSWQTWLIKQRKKNFPQ